MSWPTNPIWDSEGLPEAFDDCGCDCHQIPGVCHCIPCCGIGRSLFKPYKELQVTIDTKPVVYPFICGSPSKPQSSWLGFNSRERAEEHQQMMNNSLATYDLPNGKWNKVYWATKPEPWVVIDNPEYAS